MKSLEDKIAQVQPRPNNLVFVLGSMLESMLHSTLKSRHYVTTPLRWVEPTCCALGPSKCGVQASGTVHSVRVAVVTMPAVDINSLRCLSMEAAVAPIEEHFLQLKQDKQDYPSDYVPMCLQWIQWCLFCTAVHQAMASWVWEPLPKTRSLAEKVEFLSCTPLPHWWRNLPIKCWTQV